MSDEPRDETAGPAPFPAPPPSSPQWVALGAAFAGGVLAGMAVTAAVFVFVLRPVPSPSLIQRESAPAVAPIAEPASIPEPAPASSTTSPVAEPTPAAPGGTSRPEASRSRGRTDWLFFFKPGDQLVRMGDDAALGMVIRIVPQHAFPDGTVGPAYVLQLPDGGGQRVVDADEVERGGRLQ
jgi:hypothetical protein